MPSEYLQNSTKSSEPTSDYSDSSRSTNSRYESFSYSTYESQRKLKFIGRDEYSMHVQNLNRKRHPQHVWMCKRQCCQSN